MQDKYRPECNEDNDTQLYSEKDAANLLGVSRLTLWRWRQRGLLAYVKIGSLVRYTPEDLGKFIAAHRHAPATSRGKRASL